MLPGLIEIVSIFSPKLEDRVTRRQIIECFHRRSLWHREEALYFACEAVEIGFENRGALVARKLADGIATAAQRAGEDDFTRRADIAHPVGIAAGAN
jgi:hypothetical protein